MKIAIYYDDKNLPTLNYERPDLGNPGLGGSQYCLQLLIYYLKKYRPDYEILVLSYVNSKYAEGVINITISDFYQALRLSIAEECDFLIMKHESETNILDDISKSKQKVIFWAHNYYFSKLADVINSNDSIVANVFVGKQQYDRYIDHPICNKSTYIFNMLADPLVSCERNNDSRTVVYMGALVPSKGFLCLAKMWKSIIKEVPSAKLKVIGTGTVYSRESKLGSYGVADDNFEKQFIPYISENGKLLDSVEFLGLLGAEKNEFFLNASVGVINPSAKTETFGMGIIEMSTAKLPVVTLNKNGFPDTIINNKTGYLCKTQKQIYSRIIKLLKEPILNIELGEAAKENNKLFSPEVIIPKWINLLEDLNNNTALPYSKPNNFYFNNLKFLRVFNRFLRVNCGLIFIPPLISIETKVNSLLNKLKSY